MRIRLHVNGQWHALEAEIRTSLLDALRDGLGLTGAKRVCDRGECGACTVLACGRPIYSCLALACEYQDVPLVTIEGLAPPDAAKRMHPVQDAFVRADALQCGFCTPGQILSVVALLAAHPQPSDAQIAQALAGNLCRCGTYPKIRRAIRLAQKQRGQAR
ncbi:MAG: (2Fe-2S)-binding protein [Gemmatimonadetes bacterium]|nr:(2Fe-2S)-binding protein [Gemmatimonadota bacterium]